MNHLYDLLSRQRFHLDNEKYLQAQIEELFLSKNITFEREKYLSKKDIIDFLCQGTGVEVKLGGRAPDIYRQLERYTAHPEVTGIILYTNKIIGLPKEINGKPCMIINMSKAWL